MAKTIKIDKVPGDKHPKKRNWLKTAGIVSGILWVTGIAGALAFKYLQHAPAQGGEHAKAEGHGHEDHSAADHGEATDAHAAEAQPSESHGDAAEAHGKDSHAKAEPESHAEAGHAKDAHGKDAHGDAHAKTPAKGHAAEGHGEAAHAKAAPEPHGKQEHAEDSHGDSHAEAQGEGHAKAAPGSHGDANGKAAAKAAEHGEQHGEAHTAPAKAAHGEAHGDGHAAKHGSEGASDAVPTVTGPGSDDERNALRELAEIHTANKNLEKAVYPLRKLMVVAGKDLPLFCMATEVFLGTGNYKEALTAARKALKLAPDRVDLETAAAMARYRLGEVHEAMSDAEAALKKHPKDLELLTALGTMEIEQGPAHPHYGESLEKALKLKPTHVPALYQLGRKAQLEGDYHDAESQFRKVLKLDPKHGKAHGQLGTALYHQKKDDGARKEFEVALKLNAKDYNTWFNLGEVQLSLAGIEPSPARIRTLRTEALGSYLKAVELNPAHAEAHFRVGVILNGNAQFKEAIRHLEVSRKSDGYHVPTLVQLAVAYEGLKQPAKAKAWLEKALELDPDDKIVHLKLKLLSRSEPSEGA